jgi:hypothetical protein
MKGSFKSEEVLLRDGLGAHCLEERKTSRRESLSRYKGLPTFGCEYKPEFFAIIFF